MFRRVNVREFEQGVLYRDGRLIRVLDPGIHWVRGEVVPVDLRRRDWEVDAAPVLTRDLVPIGIRLQIAYRVTDPVAALRTHLVHDAVSAVHRSVSGVPMADLAAEHNRLEFAIQDRLAIETGAYGLRVEDVAIVQVRFPKALRRKLKRMEVGGLP